ncbi:MAG: exodeoxyribonuclease VII small subunit [Alphaproteobacteria bacterium]|nr:MAG: exodeoxyribonuclease VII small subunit [Alphaproteobacteria bacterium]
MSKSEQVTIPKDIQKLSFEEALAELEGIVGKLESGAAKLEESIDFYARGTQLKAHCQNKLKDAQSKVEKLVVSASGDLGTEPLDVE